MKKTEYQKQYEKLAGKASDLECEVAGHVDFVERSSVEGYGYAMIDEARELYLQAAQVAGKMRDRRLAKNMKENAEDCKTLSRRLAEICVRLCY